MATEGTPEEISRRKFLTTIVAGSGAIMAAAIATPLVGYFLSPIWKQQQTRTIPIAQASSIPMGVPTFVRFEQRVPDAWVTTTESEGVWIVTKDGQNFTVFDPHCTHLRCPFYWDDTQKMFACPCHGGKFSIDGTVLGGPPPRPLDRWEATVQGGEIVVTGKIIKG
jgi:menaquinol-cytochrome c reductase iron-sulfur subunit